MQVKFEYEHHPDMRPIRIPTKDLGFFGAIWLWLTVTRKWEVISDWKFKIDGVSYIIPKGEIIDGASIPKYFWNWLSPTGVLLMPSLVHDYLYKHGNLMLEDRTSTPDYTRLKSDRLFRDIAIDVNGFVIINKIAYFALRPFGWMSWKSKR